MEREHERCLPAGGRSEEQPAGLHPQPGHSVRLHLLPCQLQPRDWRPLRLHHPAGRPGQPPPPLLHPQHLGRLIQGTQIAAFVLNDGGILSDSVEIWCNYWNWPCYKLAGCKVISHCGTSRSYKEFQVVCMDRPASPANINDKKFLIEVSSIKGRRTRIEMKDRSIFLLNNLTPNSKYNVTITEQSSHFQRSNIIKINRRLSWRHLLIFSSQSQTLLVETLARPSEMVAESVVNNIQSGTRDNSAGDDHLILQLVIVLTLGKALYSLYSRYDKLRI